MLNHESREADPKPQDAFATSEYGPKTQPTVDRAAESQEELPSKYAPTLTSDQTGPSPAQRGAPFQHYTDPKIANINGEQVEVHSEEEADEARAVLSAIESQYTVEVSSQKGVAALRQQYDQLPPAIQAKVRTDAWQMKELRALQRALTHFAPLLGKQRESSNGRDIPQQVISISKLREGATDNSPTGQLDGARQKKTSGEYFPQGRNFSCFAAATSQTVDGLNNEQSLEATAVHEMAHGLLGYRLVDFVAEIGYWKNAFDQQTRVGAEKPVTPYGETSPGEDLAETVKFFFLQPKELQKRSRKRYDFMVKEVASWNGKPPAKP